jgi:glucan phosphorylase
VRDIGVNAPEVSQVVRGSQHGGERAAHHHLADLKSYSEAHARLGGLYADKVGWSRKAILNIASSGMFSSVRTIAEYAKEIWPAEACPVE